MAERGRTWTFSAQLWTMVKVSWLLFLQKIPRSPGVTLNSPRDGGGAAGDNMHLGPGFGYDEIMYVLGHALGADVEAGLHRLGNTSSPGQSPDKIAVVQFKFPWPRYICQSPPKPIANNILLNHHTSARHL